MPKRVHLGSGLDFASIASAKAHFDPIRSNGPVDVDISPSQFADLKALYEEYCRKTGYTISSAVIAFYPTMEKRNGGYTRCLGVRFQDGSRTTFSLDKALSSVASSA